MTRDALSLRAPRAARLTLSRETARAALPLIVGGFVAGRLIVVAAAFLSETILARNPALTSGDPAFLLRALTSWDGWYYLGVARDGYHVAAVTGAYHDYAFLPLFPLLVRLVAAPVPQAVGAVSVLLANAAFLVALLLLYQLGRPRLGAPRAALACFLLAISPFATIFSMAYAESLFLCLSIGAFLAAERHHRAAAGLLLALAALTRLQGAILVLPLLVLLLRQDGWRPRLSQAWLLLGPLAAVAFLTYVGWLTGSAGAYGQAQADWGRVGIGGAAPGQVIGATFAPIQVTLLAILCASLFPLVYARVDHLPPEYLLVPVLYLGAAFASGSLESIGRYVTVAFPLFWLIAARRNIFWRRLWPVLSAGLLAVFALLSFGGYWVP